MGPRRSLSRWSFMVLAGFTLGFLAGCGGGGGGGSDTSQGGTPGANQAPVANAGSSQDAMTGDAVALIAANSTDPEGGPLTYSWAQTGGPTITLSGAGTVTATFTAPDVGQAGEDLSFSVTVTDPEGAHSTASVVVHVSPRSNRPPVAVADPADPAATGGLVVLDGSRSSDPDGDALTYAWTQTNGPGVTLTGGASATATFTAPDSGAGGAELVFQLTVSDPGGLSSAQEVTVAVGQTDPPVPAPTSLELIDRGVAEGTLTNEEGLVYKVFSTFGDTRLPAEYRGPDVKTPNATSILNEARARYDTLSETAKAEVYPFLLPAYVTNGWYDLQTMSGRRAVPAGAAGRVSRTAASDPAHPWKWVTNGKVKIWYEDGYTVTFADGISRPLAEVAEGLLDAVGGTIWDKLQTLMEREPLSDAGLPPPNPPYNYGEIPGSFDSSGALDIILVRGGMSDWGFCLFYKAAPPTPSFITLDVTWQPLGDATTPGMVQTAAHELLHAWQFSYPWKDDWKTYLWLMESTAMWAEDYVYPEANTENRNAKYYLNAPSLPLPLDDAAKRRIYGGYTAFSYWTNSENGGPPDIVRQAWEAAASNSSLDAADSMNPVPEPYASALPAYMTSFFGRFWGDFVVAAWNRGPDGFFFKKDELTDGAQSRAVKAVDLAGAKDQIYFLDELDPSGRIEIPYLSVRYYRFLFPDDNVRSVYFHDGLSATLDWQEDAEGTTILAGTPTIPDPLDPGGAMWRLIAKIGGQWQEWEPLQGFTTGTVPFCRDMKAERLEELVVVLANSSHDPSRVVSPPGLAPALQVSNLACWRWEGTATATTRESSGYQEDTTATVVWARPQEVVPQYVPAGVETGAFLLLSGQFSTRIGGSSAGSDGCSYSGGDAWSWDATTQDMSQSPDAAIELLRSAAPPLPGLALGMYRKYDGNGDSGQHLVSYTRTCPEEEPVVVDIVASWWRPSDDHSPEASPEVSADGIQLQGSTTVNESNFTWNFRALREE